jgi:uncharacterized protein YggE
MRTHLFSSRAIRAAMIVLVGAAAASACSAQDNATHRAALTVTGGQGGYVVIPDTTPAAASYALTGEQSQSQQAVQAWHREAGPVFSYGNSRIVIPTR